MKHWISPDIKYKTFMKNKNCKKEFGSCQCPDCIIPVRNDSTKTWQEEFDKEFCDNGPIGEHNSIKNFISKAIAQTREETIKEILSQLRLKLRNTYKAEDIADTAFLTESDLEGVLNL